MSSSQSEGGRKGGAVTRDRYGSEFYAALGKKGGATNAQRHGTEHFQAIGRKGGARVRELLARGRELERAEREG